MQHATLHTLECQQITVQARMLGVIASAAMFKDLVDVALVILTADRTWAHKVAGLLADPVGIAALFFAGALALVPYAFMTTFSPQHVRRRLVTKIACFGMGGPFLLWGLMAFTARNLDIGWVPWVWVGNSIACLALAFVLAKVLNDHAVREHFKTQHYAEVQ